MKIDLEMECFRVGKFILYWNIDTCSRSCIKTWYIFPMFAFEYRDIKDYYGNQPMITFGWLKWRISFWW